MNVEIPKFNIFERIIVRIEKHSLTGSADRLAKILPSVIYSDKANMKELLVLARKSLKKFFRAQSHLVPKIINATILRLHEYNKDNTKYHADRSKMFDILIEDIQLYGIVIDILDSDEGEYILDTFDKILKEKFDKKFQLSPENQRLLRIQERYIEEYNQRIKIA